MRKAETFVLDTHAWLWAAEGRVAPRIAKRIDAAGVAGEL